MNDLSLTIQKLWPMEKFLRTNWRTDGQKLYAPDLSMRGHKKEVDITIPYMYVRCYS